MASYIEITEIIAPNEAIVGATVNVTVKVKSLATRTIWLIVRALDTAGVWHNIIDSAVNTYAGSTYSFSGSFTMPRYTATIWAYSYWLVETFPEDWVSDDTKWKNIYLAEEPEYRGSLSRKELEYDESRGAIPVY